MIAAADVLVENFRPGTMESFGYGYEAARQVNPRLIFCSISGFGHTGPKSALPGYDLIIQGEGGVSSLTGSPDGPPFKVGTSPADVVAGMMGFQGILLSLLARQQTGCGQKVDIGMLDCQVALLTYQAGIYFATGESPTRMGNQHPTITPYETYRCADGYINLACGNDSMWRTFCGALGRDEWTADARFATNADRVQHRTQLQALLEPVMRAKTTREWVDTLQRHGVPCGVIQSVGEVCEDPQVQARDMVVDVQHPKAGALRVTGVPVKLSETPGGVTAPPPLLGAAHRTGAVGVAAPGRRGGGAAARGEGGVRAGLRHCRRLHVFVRDWESLEVGSGPFLTLRSGDFNHFWRRARCAGCYTYTTRTTSCICGEQVWTCRACARNGLCTDYRVAEG